MKKFAKMSLVAAVAVAGFTSANAGSLEEAIKNVDISGMVRYRYTETNKEDGKSMVENDYDIELTAKVKVNDMTTAVIKFDVDGDLRADRNADTLPATDIQAANANPTVDVENAYFSFALPYATVTAGKQGVPGPLTDDLNGTGLTATIPAGPVTVALAYFNASDAAYNDIAAIGVLGSFGPVNASVWYADVNDVSDAYTVAIDGMVGPVSLAARYSEKDMDANSTENEVLKISASADLGMFSVRAAFAKTGDDNSANGGVALDGESDAAVNDFQLKQTDAADLDDATAYQIGVSVSPVEKITLGLDYMDIDYEIGNNNADYDEVLLSASYQMSSNFKISTYFSAADMNGKDSDEGRLELKYSF